MQRRIIEARASARSGQRGDLDLLERHADRFGECPLLRDFTGTVAGQQPDRSRRRGFLILGRLTQIPNRHRLHKRPIADLVIGLPA